MNPAGSGRALAIRAEGVHKRFGRIEALRGAALHVPKGTVFALIGTNGAGKTTLFSILCGFLRADRGEVEVLGGPRLRLGCAVGCWRCRRTRCSAAR